MLSHFRLQGADKTSLRIHTQGSSQPGSPLASHSNQSLFAWRQDLSPPPATVALMILSNDSPSALPIFPVLVGKDAGRLLSGLDHYAGASLPGGYDFPALSPADRAALALHVATGHVLDPVNLLISGRVSAAGLATLRRALRASGWRTTRLGSAQTASLHPLVPLTMRWQLQKEVSGRGSARLRRSLSAAIQDFIGDVVGWRHRLHVRLSPGYDSGCQWGEVAAGGVHEEVVPIFKAGSLARLGRDPELRRLKGLFLHRVVDWDGAARTLARDVSTAGLSVQTRHWPHAGSYQGVPFSGSVMVVTLA